MNKLILFAAIFAGGLTTAAYGNWITTVEDDLFSDNKNAVMVGVIDLNSSIYARCVGPDRVELAYIEASDDASSLTSPIASGGDIVFKGDNGKRHSSPVTIYQHNASYIGFSYDDKATILAAIKDFGVADSKIAIGLDLVFNDEPFMATAPAFGSAKAVKQFIDACGLESAQ